MILAASEARTLLEAVLSCSVLNQLNESFARTGSKEPHP